MDDRIEEVIREIAAKHGIAVSRDDPILVLQTINNRLLQDSANAQRAMLEKYKEELEDIAHRWGDDSKAKAEKVLNAALTASKEAMLQTMQDGATAMAVTVKQEIDAAFGRLTRDLRETRRLSFLNIVAATVTVVAASATLWATIPRH